MSVFRVFAAIPASTLLWPKRRDTTNPFICLCWGWQQPERKEQWASLGYFYSQTRLYYWTAIHSTLDKKGNSQGREIEFTLQVCTDSKELIFSRLYRCVYFQITPRTSTVAWKQWATRSRFLPGSSRDWRSDCNKGLPWACGLLCEVPALGSSAAKQHSCQQELRDTEGFIVSFVLLRACRRKNTGREDREDVR